MGTIFNTIPAVTGPGEDESLSVLTARTMTGEGSSLSTEWAILFKFLYPLMCITHPGYIT